MMASDSLFRVCAVGCPSKRRSTIADVLLRHAWEKRLARRQQFVYNTRLWKGSEEAVTRSTRNRVIGDEPVRGFESHPFRHTIIAVGLRLSLDVIEALLF